jgi:hypothetical protein
VYFTETGSYEWYCSTLVSLPNVTYSWFRKLLPKGEWRSIDNNSERYKWRIPRTLHAKRDVYDVYDMYCEMTYRLSTFRSRIARVVVTQPGMENILLSNLFTETLYNCSRQFINCGNVNTYRSNKIKLDLSIIFICFQIQRYMYNTFIYFFLFKIICPKASATTKGHEVPYKIR